MFLDKGVWFASAPVALLLRTGLPVYIGWVGHGASMNAAETKTLLPVRNGTTLLPMGKLFLAPGFLKRIVCFSRLMC